VGVAGVHHPAGKVLITSVLVFIVIPLAAGWLSRHALIKSRGLDLVRATLSAQVPAR
jgi:arsenite transporter